MTFRNFTEKLEAYLLSVIEDRRQGKGATLLRALLLGHPLPLPQPGPSNSRQSAAAPGGPTVLRRLPALPRIIKPRPLAPAKKPS